MNKLYPDRFRVPLVVGKFTDKGLAVTMSWDPDQKQDNIGFRSSVVK